MPYVDVLALCAPARVLWGTAKEWWWLEFGNGHTRYSTFSLFALLHNILCRYR
jgi:hypothetical protein